MVARGPVVKGQYVAVDNDRKDEQVRTEAFFTLTSLAHADSTATLPILLGIITLANVESSRWFVSPAELQREAQVAKWTAERRAKGEQILEPRKISQSALRILSVGRILIAAMVPGVSSTLHSACCVARS